VPLSALGLVLAAGLIHAAWNLIAKRAAAGSDFVILYSTLGVVLYAPVAVWLGLGPIGELPAASWMWIAASGLLHCAYGLLLQRGYLAGDLTVVYPVARGTGPLLAGIVAVTSMGEPLGLSTAAGYVLVLSGMWLLSGAHGPIRAALQYGLAIGVCIAAYTLVDTHVVRTTTLPPFVIDYLSNLTRTIILLPLLVHRRDSLGASWRQHWKPALAVAALAPLAYIGVLYALRIAPVSRVAPAREVSMLFAVLLSALVLKEQQAARRFFAAGLIAAGVIALSWRA
jgi:drug/metabolite transporter (DMT)-like permease